MLHNHSKAFRVVASVGAVTLIVIGIVTGFAAISFWWDSPYSFLSKDHFMELSALLTMISVGSLLIMSGIIIYLDTNYDTQAL